MTQTPTMDQERPITLREEELLKRGQHLAQQLAVRDGLVEEKAFENKKRQKAIDELDAEISKIASQIRDGFENRRQGDLFVDQALPKDKAAATLIDIAQRAERHPFTASETAIDTCAHEACGKAAQDETHTPPPPLELHTFAPDGSGDRKCWACGSRKDDPIHAELQADPASEIPATVETTTEPKTVECSRCGETKSDAYYYDSDARPICETCKRAAIEAGTWPHPFRKGHEKARRCADCNRKADDETHVEPPPVEAEAAPAAPPSGGDPAFDFPADEPPPNIIRTHAAIESSPERAEDEVGGEA